ncbi:MAG: MerR family transcriptional regulator [Gammaproteobacteria bacterium]|nr:MerR family transcriptional regulator [Gammaproteobacteria bacterium]
MPSDPATMYPIREVSQKTGVNPVTLRAWQRRYGLIKPARTDSGHRLYSEQDIATIQQVLNWLEKGVSIGQVKSLLQTATTESTGSNWEQINLELIELAQQLNLAGLESRLRELSKLYPVDLLLGHVIRPWLLQLSQLERPDRAVIEQSGHGLLQQLLIHWLSIHSGPMIAVMRCGKVSALDSLLTRYELQGVECRSLDLGQIEPTQLPLIQDRLSVDAYLVLLGAGLTESWFNKYQTVWPDNSFFCGDIGNVYFDMGWLDHPYHPSVTQLVRQHEASFGLV